MADHSGHHGPPQSPDPREQPKPTMGTHGMLIVGAKTTYLSHFPMFMFDEADHAHNFQVILEVAFGPPAAGATPADYVGDRRAHPDTRLYTFVPAPFEMDHLRPDEPRLTSLTGAVHRGHFERHSEDGGKRIGQAKAQVVKTVLFRPFRQGAQRPSELEYVLFGRPPELFLAHLITGPPDFDQLLSVAAVDPPFSDDDLSEGVDVTVPGRPDTARTRLKAGDRVAFRRAGAGNGPGAGGGELEVGDELYFEEGELGTQFDPAQTPEEKRAGF